MMEHRFRSLLGLALFQCANSFFLFSSASSSTTCIPALDSCPYKFDGTCDAGIFCPHGTDCFDCDPCMQHRFDGCSGCTATEGCSWCAEEALCLSEGTAGPESSSSCKASSDFVTTCKENKSGTLGTDPLFESQNWLYDLVNVKEAWDMGYTGKGIHVRVNDDGVDHTHPELRGQFDVSKSCSVYKPATLTPLDGHGTAVASIAAGAAGDGSCAAGIAHKAGISGCRIINSSEPREIAQEIFDGTVYFDRSKEVHVSQNSYGTPVCDSKDSGFFRRRLQKNVCPFNDQDICQACGSVNWSNPSPNADCESSIAEYCNSIFKFGNDEKACLDFLDLFTECEYNSLHPADQRGLQEGIQNGRDGKGIIYVFASGNTHDKGSDVNFEGTLTSRYTVAVGAIGRDGLHASYSTSGAALHVTAPGGDVHQVTNILVANAGGGCHDIGQGTSFAAPIVSGVVALMLEANDSLTWRDVQGVLATSSRKVSDGDWTTNSAGFHHSYNYGFGVVDAGAAVKTAVAWENYPPEVQIVHDSRELDVVVPDFGDGDVVAEIKVDRDDFAVESVMVYLDLLHSSRGDLEITLVSPTGTESILHPSKRPENSQVERWKLMSVRHWGEGATGSWSLRLTDHREGDIGSSCLDKAWTLKLDEVTEIDCKQAIKVGFCKNGRKGDFFDDSPDLDLDDPIFASTTGVTPDDACCECGGGHSASDFTNILRSWKLVLSGHSTENIAKTTAPTSTAPVAATTVPTKSPTLSPTKSPSFSPSSLPSQEPTTGPSLPPTKATVLLSEAPSSKPSYAPVAATNPPLTVSPTATITVPPANLPTAAPSTSSSVATQTNGTNSTDPSTPEPVLVVNATNPPTVAPSAAPVTSKPTVQQNFTNPSETETSATSSSNDTVTPTASPSTAAPSASPTTTPTTVSPSSNPSSQPTTTSPSVAPSTRPSKAPTTVAPTTVSPTTVQPSATVSTRSIPASSSAYPTISTTLVMMIPSAGLMFLIL